MATYQEDAVSVPSSDMENTMHSGPTEPHANPNQEAQTKKRRKLGTKSKTAVKVEPAEDTPVQATKPTTKVKKGTKLKAKKKKDTKVVRTEQEEYADADYQADEEEWYDDVWRMVRHGQWVTTAGT